MKTEKDLRIAILEHMLDGNKLGIRRSAIDDLVRRMDADWPIVDAHPSVPEYLAHLRESAPHYFERRDAATDGSANSSDPAGAQGGFTAEQIARMSPYEKLALANERMRPAGVK